VLHTANPYAHFIQKAGVAKTTDAFASQNTEIDG
jgi:hypothetical protein